jgi:hypothetical protein
VHTACMANSTMDGPDTHSVALHVLCVNSNELTVYLLPHLCCV